MRNWNKIAFGVGLAAMCSAMALAADSIGGVARNQTSGSLAAGDEVILLRLDQGMQEEARTSTDSRGVFALPVLFPDKAHLVRVLHQGVNYDQRASSGNLVSIDVFDSAPKVKGVTGSIEIIRTGTNGKLLHVSDMIELKNDSRPPLTQTGERTFEVFLPRDAKIDSVMAAGPGKIAVLISAAPVPGEPGHFTVNFPLRPGATKFAFNYDVTYDGRARFRPRTAYPLQQLAVMIPPTMKFTSRSSAFQMLPTGNNRYLVAAASPVEAGEGPEFEISGAGALPALQAQTQSPPKTHPALPAPLSSSGMATASTSTVQGYTFFPLSRLQWWVLALVTGLALGVYVLLLWRGPRLSHSAIGAEKAPQTSTFRVEVLQRELFQLEIDRATGAISREEYDSAKQALEGTVQRVLGRGVGARAS
jgi:hypothetical protein